MYTLMIISAALSYSVGSYYMKLAEGFSKVTPSVLVFAFFLLGAAFQTVAMRGSQMTVTYIIVLGVEALTAFALGVFFLSEVPSLIKIVGTSLILIGTALLRSS